MKAKYKILNLYCCIGGNRYKWNEVSTNIEITAIEKDPLLAQLYRERFPNDIVIETDAHQYLIDHYKDFDFIWTSPPCPTHSRANFWGSKTVENRAKVYPDMKLYEEILFLQHWFEGDWLAENVIPYYTPLITAQKRGRHLYWSNIKLPQVLSTRKVKVGAGKDEVKALSEFHDFDFYQYKGEQRTDKIARNLVDYEAGRTILETVMKIRQSKNIVQPGLFDAVT